ncbi:MAG: hypothetical protein KJ624_02105 [Chloroflexi bacterium]|nr:hypothetical protein [Chloroflexota bacterium]
MAKFLTTRQTTSELESIITNARTELVLISPYIRIADNLFPSLQLADRKKVRTTVVYGKQELDGTVRKQLSQLEHLTLRFLEKLHAKCYYNETKMVITSLNLYDFSEGNFEMGILVDAQYDSEVYAAAKEHAQLIINTSLALKPERASGRQLATPDVPLLKLLHSAHTGYCIRCSKSIPLDRSKPYCIECFQEWNKDPNYKEKHCHYCGGRTQVIFGYPFCRACFRKVSR